MHNPRLVDCFLEYHLCNDTVADVHCCCIQNIFCTLHCCSFRFLSFLLFLNAVQSSRGLFTECKKLCTFDVFVMNHADVFHYSSLVCAWHEKVLKMCNASSLASKFGNSCILSLSAIPMRAIYHWACSGTLKQISHAKVEIDQT